MSIEAALQRAIPAAGGASSRVVASGVFSGGSGGGLGGGGIAGLGLGSPSRSLLFDSPSRSLLFDSPAAPTSHAAAAPGASSFSLLGSPGVRMQQQSGSTMARSESMDGLAGSLSFQQQALTLTDAMRLNFVPRSDDAMLEEAADDHHDPRDPRVLRIQDSRGVLKTWGMRPAAAAPPPTVPPPPTAGVGRGIELAAAEKATRAFRKRIVPTPAALTVREVAASIVFRSAAEADVSVTVIV